MVRINGWYFDIRSYGIACGRIWSIPIVKLGSLIDGSFSSSAILFAAPFYTLVLSIELYTVVGPVEKRNF